MAQVEDVGEVEGKGILLFRRRVPLHKKLRRFFHFLDCLFPASRLCLGLTRPLFHQNPFYYAFPSSCAHSLTDIVLPACYCWLVREPSYGTTTESIFSSKFRLATDLFEKGGVRQPRFHCSY